MVTQELFGTTRGGVPVYRFCIENASGASVSVMNYGCNIQAIRVPDRNGTLTDVCLGYRTLAEYEQNNGYLGAVVGRHGNRIEMGRNTIWRSTMGRTICTAGFADLTSAFGTPALRGSR